MKKIFSSAFLFIIICSFVFLSSGSRTVFALGGLSATNRSAAETYTEDTPLNLTDIVIGDSDSAVVTAALTLSATSAGSLSTATSGSVTSTYNAGTGVWTASGAIADVNTLLAGVTFVPASNFNSNFTIATSVSDGVAAAITGSKAMTGIPVNDAPVLDASKSPTLVNINKNAAAPVGAVGTPVSSLVDFFVPSGQIDNITDVDSGALLGVAIVGTDTTHATYYYSVDNGITWSALGAVSNSSARLLAASASDRIYVQPNSGFSGAISTAITFRAWDQTSGTDGSLADVTVNGSTTAFSTAIDTASITITSTNNPPVAVDDSFTISANSATTGFFVLTNDTDLDADTLSISSVTTPTHGSTSISGNAVLYTPTTDYCGSDTFDYVVSDGTATDTGTVTVTINCTTPGVPTVLTASVLSQNQITLTWTAPTTTGGAAITGYQVERESPVGAGFAVIVVSTDTPTATYSDMGLIAGTQYNYRVSAINSVGVGSASSATSATTQSAVHGGGRSTFLNVAVPPPATVPTLSRGGVHAFAFTKNLKKGMDDADVMKLQTFLGTHGYPVASKGLGSVEQPSTFFGAKTASALKHYQQSVGLPASGYFGPLTQAYINKILTQ